jgi:hypothetical protein
MTELHIKLPLFTIFLTKLSEIAVYSGKYKMNDDQERI